VANVNQLSPFTILAFKQWLAILRREGRVETTWGKCKLAWHILAAFLRIGGVTREQWLQRMETCQKCPLFDPSLWRCRPYDSAPMGCGCGVKYLALVKKPYKRGCWGTTFLPGQGIGWPGL
jgi:hypothetical protein